MTRAIFRVWKRTRDTRPGFVGSVIALLPDLPANASGAITSYEHVGQHGAADYAGVMAETRPATPDEYARLLRELTQRGYQVRVCARRGRR